jgi:hypothetical protein
MRITHFEREAPHGMAPDVRVQTDNAVHREMVFFHFMGAGFSMCEAYSAKEARKLAAALLNAADQSEQDATEEA